MMLVGGGHSLVPSPSFPEMILGVGCFSQLCPGSDVKDPIMEIPSHPVLPSIEIKMTLVLVIMNK